MTTTQVRYQELLEAKRHNVASEYETARHDKMSEHLSATQIIENKRHNLVSEKQEGTKIKETIRHNKVTEALTASDISEKIRHNQATEALTATDIAEKRRHNIASESENYRHNVATESEVRRHNQAIENLDARKIANEWVKIQSNVKRNDVQNAVDMKLAALKAKAQTSQVALNYSQVAKNLVDSVCNIMGIGTKTLSSLVPIITAML